MADKNYKDILKVTNSYGGSEDGSYVVFDSRSPKMGAGEAKEAPEGAKKTASALNKLNSQSDIIQDKMGVFRSVKSGYGSGIYGQQAIQGMMDLVNMKDGQGLIVYDTETLGTTPNSRKNKTNLNFYTPTEIGFKHAKMVNGMLQETGDSLSLLMRPTQDSYKRLNALINSYSSGKWTGMTDDVRRTLSDLMLYAGDPGRLFTTVQKDGRRITSVNSQARELHPMKGSVLTSSNNIALMREGLNNLMKHGTTPEHAIFEMNAFMKNVGETRFAGYNVYNFDQPMMLDFLNNQVGKEVGGAGKALHTLKNAMSLNQIDGLHALRTLYRDNHSRFGLDTTLETMKKVFRIVGGQSHHALSDVGTTIAQLNSLVQDKQLKKVLRAGGKEGTDYGMFNPRALKAGDALVGIKGLNVKSAGEYDGVFRKKDGQLTPAYDLKTNPLYRNANYTIDKFFNGVEIDGKKMFGVQLFNESDELYHTIFRPTQGELQNVIHQHLEFTPEVTSRHLQSSAIQNEDRAARRWRKMFSRESGGGTYLAERLYQALDIAQKGEADGLNWGAIKTNILDANEHNTDEFVRDFQTMRGRLEDEKDWVKGFLNRLNEGPLSGSSRFQSGARDAAFQEFGKLMTENFGKNEILRALPGGVQAIPLRTNGEEKMLHVTDSDSVRQGLYNHLYRGHSKRPNMGELKKRYRELLMQLKSLNALDAKRFESMYGALDHIRHDASIDNILSELSNSVVQARETSSLNGSVKHITVENPTRVEGSRKAKMKQAFASSFDAIANSAISGTAPLTSVFDPTRKDPISLFGSEAEKIIHSHDEAIANMLKRNRIDSSVNIDTSKIRSSKQALAKLTSAYTKQGFDVQLRMDGSRGGLQLVLGTKNAGSVMDGTMEEIYNSKHTAVIDLPRINADGTITMGSQNRVSRLIAKRAGKGYEFATGFDEVLGVLAGNAKYAKEVVDKGIRNDDKGAMNEVHNYLKGAGRKAMQNLSANNRFMNPGDREDMFEVRSLAANWLRGGMIDINEFAEDWYKQFYENQSKETKEKWRLKTPEKVAELALEKKDKFVNQMGLQAGRVFQRESDEYIRTKTGLEIGMHSVKDTHVSNYLRAGNDARELLAFGFYNPMARENIMKTVNYAALDEQKTRAALSRNFSDSEIDRMTKRGLVTNVAAEVLEEAKNSGKLSYLNMRAGYMDDKQLKERAGELYETYMDKAKNAATEAERQKYEGYAKKVKNIESISTFDGMMLMSEEAAAGFERTRQKSLTLSPNARLTQGMENLLRTAAAANGVEFDLSKSMDFDQAFKVTGYIAEHEELGGIKRKGNKITVAEIVKEELKRNPDGKVVYNSQGAPMTETVRAKGDPNGMLDKWNIENYRIKGWNAEEGKLIFEEHVNAMTTSKYITDGGGRVTGTNLPGEIIRDLAQAGDGNKVHAILPAFESSKEMFGTEISKYVSLAVDEAKAAIASKRITVKELDALEIINRVMHESFGFRDKSMSIVKDGQIVIDRNFGKNETDAKISYQALHHFQTQIDNELGISISNSKTIFGNVGVGAQDVYDWENGIGYIEGKDQGLVKYGRKEIDMVATRASQVLGSKNTAVVGWLNEHIRASAEAQTPMIRQIGGGLVRTAIQEPHGGIDKGDVVIRTSGEAFDPDDPMGKERGRATKNGHYEISMHAFNPLPSTTAKDMKFVSDDYVKTILDFGRVDGTFASGMSFQQAIAANKGTALLEMPDNTFASKYIRLVDFGDLSQGEADIPVLRELQKKQQQIWRGIQEYTSYGKNGEADEEELAKIRSRVNDRVFEYEDEASRLVSKARDGGLMKTFGSARLANSGRFRIQGVNSFSNYEEYTEMVDGEEVKSWRQKANAEYKEGNVYVSRARLKEMISGTESNVAKAMGLKTKGMSGDEIMEMVLDNANQDGKGIYGLMNRYPTIKQTTMQSTRFMIDEAMDENFRGARITVGTAKRLNADYDGDFLSGMLAHYGASPEEAMAIHKELRTINKQETADALEVGREEVRKLAIDLENPAKSMNMTVGQLAKEANEAEQIAEENRTAYQKKVLQEYGRSMDLNQIEDMIETREARLGKQFVGLIDNTRDRVLTAATSTIDVLERHGKMSVDTVNNYRNTIEEFQAKFSQDMISAKKFKVRNEFERQLEMNTGLEKSEAYKRATEAIDTRYLAISEMNDIVMNPTEEGMTRFRELNKEIGLYDVTSEKEMKQMNSALGMIQDVARWTATSGSFQNPTLDMGVSDGKSKRLVSPFMQGKSGIIMNTPMMQSMVDLLDEAGQGGTDSPGSKRLTEMANTIQEGISRHEKSVLYGFAKSEDASKSLVDSMGTRAYDASDHVLSGATVAEEASVKLREVVGKFTPKSFGGGGVGGGMVAFGAMWATSALMRKSPTPEGLQEQTQNPVPPQKMQAPTARITENKGEYVNIRVNAKNAKNMSEQEVAALVHQELGAMTSMKMDTTLNINDNTQNIDQQWLQGVVANAMSKGMGY